MRKYVLPMVIVTGLLGAIGTAKGQTYSIKVEATGLLLGNVNVEIARSISPNSPSVSLHLPIAIRPANLIKAPVFTGFNNWVAGLQPFDRHITNVSFYDKNQYINIQPGLRYWSKGIFNRGLFFGAFAIGELFKEGGSGYDKLRDNYREGFAVGAGVSVGYAYELTSNWNVEGEIGLGGLWRNYDFKRLEDDKYVSSKSDIAGSLARCGISLVYLF